MAIKDFAMISTSLPYSSKYRTCSNLEKLVYIHLHLSIQTNYIGCFKYRGVLLADEIDIMPEELEITLVSLEAKGLIERNSSEGVIRIVGWFRMANRANNASHAMKLIKNFKEIDFRDLEILFRAISEFIVAIMKRGESWAKDNLTLRVELSPFLKGLITDFGCRFVSTLIEEIESAGKSLKPEIYSLAPALLEYKSDTLSAPCSTGGGGKRKRQDETYTNTRQNRKIEKETASELKEIVPTRGDAEQTNKDKEPRQNRAMSIAKQKGASTAAKNSALGRGKR